MHRSLALAPALLLALAPLSSAGPAADVATQLREGALTPQEAAGAWATQEVTPQAALEALQALPLREAPPKDHTATLTDDQGRESACRVLVPADGPAEDGRYRVMILLHGLGGDWRQAVKGSDGLIPPHTLVLCPSALRSEPGDLFEDLRTAGAALPLGRLLRCWFTYQPDAFPLAALEYARERYPIDPDRVILAGYSMGGFSAWNVGLRYHDRFAGLLPMAGGISREEYLFQKDPWCRILLDNAAMVPTFFIHGGRDEVVPVVFDRWTDQELTARGIEHTYVEVKGGKHVLDEFRDPLGDVKRQLREWTAARVREPHPAKVVHRLIGEYHPGAYWVRVDGYQGNTARVEAEVTGRSRIEVSTRGVSRLTVFLDPALVDVEGEVELVVDGQPAFTGRVEPSLEAVAASWARTRDPALTYAHAVSVEVTPREVEELKSGLDGLFKQKK